MRKSFSLTVSVLVVCLLVACSAAAQRLEPVASGLRNPVSMTNAGDERLFVVEQRGTIRVVVNGALAPDPFLDITNRVRSGGERGLLGLAFPLNYAVSGRFYVYYTDQDSNTVVARFTAQGNSADPNSEQILLTQEQPFNNHNGGQLAFGPDGFLYIGLGDGGSGGDPQNNSQDLTTFLGKLLRIDVSGDTYTVPDNNPFVGQADVRPEIWAYGLRNPWRFSFDSSTGNLFIADVGQSRFEEVNFQRASSRGGENYGWRIMEASACYHPSSGCDMSQLVLPIIEYPHGNDWGRSVSGGYVYRGASAPGLVGAYVFADYVSGRIWTARADDDWQPELLLESGFRISTFGVGANADLYVADHHGGVIYRLVGLP